MLKTDNYWIKNIALANEGQYELTKAIEELQGFKTMAEDLSAENPLKDVKIAGCLHLTPQVGVFIESLVKQGAEVQWTSCKLQNTNDKVAAYLAKSGIVKIFAWKDMSIQEQFQCLKRTLTFKNQGPNLIVDDQGILTELIHVGVDAEMYYEANRIIPTLEDLG